VRHLGLDIGEARTGVAVSDPSGTVATPLTILDSRALERDPVAVLDLLAEYDVGVVVIGLPLTMAGDEGPQAARVRQVGEMLAGAMTIPVTYWDERLSTSAASRAMSEGGVRSRKQRGGRDHLAATVVLQSYLDADARGTEGASVD
jgi:putative Holliday junction resolvase